MAIHFRWSSKWLDLLVTGGTSVLSLSMRKEPKSETGVIIIIIN